MKLKAAYIHIPFCEHICHYCDFNKVFMKGQPVDEYLDALEQEINLTLKESPTSGLQSIFVGGGTPTALSESQLARLCEIIQTNLPYNGQTEFTFEANPGDLSEGKLEVLYKAGVNRLSFGVQTFNDQLLEKIGRSHRAKDVFRSVEAAKKMGFENISLDLIYSLPGQTVEDFLETLSTAFSLDVVHYSAYSLIIEPKTVFYNLMRKGKLPVPGEDLEAKMYELVMNEMAANGFHQYEISNFAKEGFESKHNLTYWNNDFYYGFGAGAHSYVNGIRKANYGPLKKYMEPILNGDLPTMEEHQVTRTDRLEEEMFLGLRKSDGIKVAQFMKKFGDSPYSIFQKEISELTELGLLKANENEIALTRKGRLLGNEVFEKFIGVIEE
jgi:oxygen-independent coproporphyrinogen-3 oxidase